MSVHAAASDSFVVIRHSFVFRTVGPPLVAEGVCYAAGKCDVLIVVCSDNRLTNILTLEANISANFCAHIL